jgi:hypothetical protein
MCATPGCVVIHTFTAQITRGIVASIAFALDFEGSDLLDCTTLNVKAVH